MDSPLLEAVIRLHAAGKNRLGPFGRADHWDPKELYTRYRHLGVYAWKHVLETADGNLEHPVMAFRFSRTERFARPITLAQLQQIGMPQPQNPRRITAEQFAAIYKLGMNL